MIRILIADDHPVVRHGLKQILSAQPDMEVAGEARDGLEVLKLTRTEDWDVAVIDFTMPGKSGLELLKQLRQEHPDLPVLVLSMHPEEQFGIRALKDGAAGYMTKESAPQELVKAVRRVVAHGKYVSETLAERLAMALEKGADGLPHESLSDREYRVLCLIASGRTVGQVATELYLSASTVSTYRARVLRKLGLATTAELTHYAIQNRLVE
jgi:two-component system, NarL family, invasion response regulator UvrY